MRHLVVAFILTVLTLALTVPALAEAPDAAGFWKGGIEVPGREFPVMIEIEKQAETWSADLFILAQGVREEPMKDVSINGAEVSFKIPEMPGDPIFVGKLSEDGASITGEYTQGGQTMPFSLARDKRPEELNVDVYAEFRKTTAKGNGLPGTWRSVFRVGPHRYRMVLEVSSGEAEGAYTATIQNQDRGPGEPQPVSGATLDGNTVKVILSPGAEFEGTLSDDGSGISGLFKQAGQEFPLEFWRAG